MTAIAGRPPEAKAPTAEAYNAKIQHAPPVHEEHEGAEHRYLIAFAVVLASLMQVIDSSIVNVALPDMMGTFGANLDEIAWVSTGYILASVIIIPLTGWLGSFFGRKRYFVGSIVLFTASSFFCGAAHSLATLVIWRILQGIGGGALMTVSQAVLFESFPRKEAGMAMALFGLGVMVGPTIGPTLGGWLTDSYGWPWIFYVNLPLGVLAAMMITAYVHDPAHQRKPPTIDYQGIALLAMAAGGFQYVLEYGQREDWFDSSLITSLTVISTIGGVALLWRELTTRNPVINFRVLKHRQMWVGTLLGVVMGVGLYAMSFTLPVFLQTDLHMTAMQAGIAMLPGAIATAISMWVVGRLMNIVDARISIMLGALIFAASAWQLSTITSASGRSDFFWPLIGRGIGLGLMFVPLTTITLAELKGTELAQGAGLYNFFRQLGGSFGIAVIASLLTRYTNQTRAVLGEHVAMGDPTSMARIQMMTQAMIGHGSDPVTARHQALMLLDRQLYGQASILAYSRIYIISAFLMLALIPLLVLVRETQRPSGATEILE
jgi:MFS transporter, DHA2 family, multidrug resistance protein